MRNFFGSIWAHLELIWSLSGEHLRLFWVSLRNNNSLMHTFKPFLLKKYIYVKKYLCQKNQISRAASKNLKKLCPERFHLGRFTCIKIILDCYVIILDLHTGDLEDYEEVFKTLKDSSFLSLKTVILISNVFTWVDTPQKLFPLLKE